MDTTIRNLDPRVYRSIKARAVMTGRNVGDLVNEALRGYLNRTAQPEKSGSLRQLEPVDFPIGNERLSEKVDAIVYGAGAR
jgi:plasmid stability protein